MKVGSTSVTSSVTISSPYMITAIQDCLQGKRTGWLTSKVMTREKCSGKSAAANFCSVHLHSLSCRPKMWNLWTKIGFYLLVLPQLRMSVYHFQFSARNREDVLRTGPCRQSSGVENESTRGFYLNLVPFTSPPVWQTVLQPEQLRHRKPLDSTGRPSNPHTRPPPYICPLPSW